MANPVMVLKKLQQTLDMKYGDELGIEGLGSLSSPYSTHFSPDDPDDYVDVPDVPDTEYITQKTFQLPSGSKKNNRVPKYVEQQLYEQGEEEEKQEKPSPEEMGTEPGAATGEEATGEVAEPEGTPGEEMGAGGVGDVGGMDMGGMPGQEEEEPKTAGELGRIYELKKIYARLTSLESYLAQEADQQLLRIRTLVSQSIELFEIISANFEAYKDRLDEIIILYYKFLKGVYNTVRDYYKKHFKDQV